MPRETKQELYEEHLPDAELDVMGVLWRSDEPLKTADIHKALDVYKRQAVADNATVKRPLPK